MHDEGGPECQRDEGTEPPLRRPSRAVRALLVLSLLVLQLVKILQLIKSCCAVRWLAGWQTRKSPSPHRQPSAARSTLKMGTCRSCKYRDTCLYIRAPICRWLSFITAVYSVEHHLIVHIHSTYY